MNLFRALILASVVALFAVGCGGGGGGEIAPPAETVEIAGRVYAGAIAGGTVRAYAIRTGGRSLVQESAVGRDGSYALKVSPEVVLLEYFPSTNATLEDIVTRVTTPLPADFVLRAVYDFTGIGSRTVAFNITPWSEIATGIAERLGVLNATNINLANSGLIGSMQANFLAAKIIDPAQASSPGTMPEDANVAILNAMISYMGSVGALGCPVKLDAAGRIRCIAIAVVSEARVGQVGVARASSIISSGRQRPAAIGGAIADGLFSFGQAAQSAILAGYQASAVAYLSAAQAVQAGATATVTSFANVGTSVLVSVENIAAKIYAPTFSVETRSAYQKLLTSDEQVVEARRVFDFAAISSLVYDPFFISDVGFDASAYSAINTHLLGLDGTQYTLSVGWRTFDWKETNASIRPTVVAEAMNGFKTGFQYNVFYNDKFLVIAYRGTDFDGLNDLLSDLNIAICTNPQYAKANVIYQTLKIDPTFMELLKTRKLVLTGHSLGGGIAAYVAAHNPLLEVVTFNSAPLCTADVAIQAITSPNYSRDIKNIVISGEILTGFIYLQLGVFVFRVGDSTIYPNPYLLSLYNQFDSHGMSAVLFSLDVARKENCEITNCETHLTTLTASLFGSSSISTSIAPFRAAIKLIGTGLSGVERITWSCININNERACSGSPYVWEKTTSPKLFQFRDTEADLNPVLIASSDKAGSYRWDVVLSTGTVSTPPITFTVQYAPPAFNPAALRPLSIPGQVVSTGGSSILTFNFSGTQFDAIQSIEWAWSGTLSGVETWVKGSAEWNANVSIASDGSLSVRRPIASSIAAAGGSTEWRISLVSDQGVRATRLFGLTATPSPGNTPNLVVQNINFSPIGVDPGGAVQLNFTVTNQGSATAAASSAVVHINQSSTSEAGPDLGTSSVPSLAVDTSFSATATVIAPATPGTYRIWVIAGNGSTAGPIKAVLGTGTLTVAGPSLTPVVPPKAVDLAAGSHFTCALTAAGGMKCWGRNLDYQLGDGTRTDRLTPVGVLGLSSGVVAIAPGGGHTCALTTTGGVKCWGFSRWGQAGRLVEMVTQPTAVLTLDSGVASIAPNWNHTCALSTQGSAKCWGHNLEGQVGDGTFADRSTPTDVFGLGSGVIALARGGSNASCAVTTAGGVKCWGNNASGELGDGTLSNRNVPVDVLGLSTGVTEVTTGNGHACAVTTAGSVKCWGGNDKGQLGNGTRTGSATPTDVVGLSGGVTTVTTSSQHTCALTSARGVKCWGDNSGGQLGDGTLANRSAPVDVVGLTSGVMSIATGLGHSCARMITGNLKCWGRNYLGALGDGTLTDRLTPVDVVGF